MRKSGFRQAAVAEPDGVPRGAKREQPLLNNRGRGHKMAFLGKTAMASAPGARPTAHGGQKE